ncbi:MAG: trypsin-like peptidase domain-containing protein [Ruminococcus sp.]|nr:trypsin-like peptidase domain-containing protein [Ruminococcus sp.]
MDEFNRYNGYNEQNNRSEQQTGYQQQGYYDYGSYNYGADGNEVVYKPQKKSGKGKKILTAIAGILAVAAIGTTSIVGYSLVTGNKLVGSSDDSSSLSASASTSKSSASTEKKTDDTAKNVKRELPTIEQLASPDDAMKIPDIVNKVSPSVVGISCMTSAGTAKGTGIIMTEDGYIITNAHVVEGARSISVLLPSSYSDESQASASDLTVEAELIGKDTQTDIAVLKINKTGLTKAEFGKSSDLQVGEVAIVIGNPLGFELANSVTAGIISALDRTITVEDRVMNTIQTDAAINNGNSGGPLINAYGQVVGITSAKVTNTYGEGLGFAIPIDEAIPIIADLIQNGYVTGRPTLGVTGETVSNVYSQYYNIPKGFFVRTVNEGSSAQKAGIKVGDIIIGIEGQLIESLSEFNKIKDTYKAGDVVKISVYRDGEILDFEVTLDESVEEEEDTQQQTQDDYYRQYREYFSQFPF